jgi:DNA transformation protein
VANSETFVAHALDLLAPLGRVEARRMFGGHGVYAAGVMFALLDDDELFLKTDPESRPLFVAAGCRRWVYPGVLEETSYFRPPDDAHEDPEAMLPWARLALDAALRLKAAKEAKARAAAERRAARRGTMPGCEGSSASSSSRSPPPRAPRSRSGSAATRRRGPTRRRS